MNLQNFNQDFSINFASIPGLLPEKVLGSILILLVAYLLLFVFIGLINNRIQDVKRRHIARKNAIYAINFITFITICLLWLQNIKSVTLFWGFLSAGLALALQEVIMCVAGWFFIFFRRPFAEGDRIEINAIKGDVIDVRVFQTTLLEVGNWVGGEQSTGRIVSIPNSYVFKMPHYNYSRGFEFIWNEIPFVLTCESDWQKAKSIILHHAQKQAEGLTEVMQKNIESLKNHYMIYYEKLTPIVYVAVKERGIELTLRYLTAAQKRRPSQDHITQAVLEDFAKEQRIRFAVITKP